MIDRFGVWQEISEQLFGQVCAACHLQKLDGDILITWHDENAKAILKQEKEDGRWVYYLRAGLKSSICTPGGTTRSEQQ